MSPVVTGALRQLTSLDAQFLAMDDPRNHARVSRARDLRPSTTPGSELTKAGGALRRQRLLVALEHPGFDGDRVCRFPLLI